MVSNPDAVVDWEQISLEIPVSSTVTEATELSVVQRNGRVKQVENGLVRLWSAQVRIVCFRIAVITGTL